MKLHLPKSMMCALAAAVAAASFVAPQAFAATDNGYTIITSTSAVQSWGDYNIYITGMPSTAMPAAGNVVENAALGESGITYTATLVNGGGRINTTPLTDLNSYWTNTAAIEQMNTDMGTSLTLSDLSALGSMGGGQAGRTIALTLDFTNSTGDARIGKHDEVTFYVGLASSAGTVNNFSIGGLAGATYSYASATGEGFSSTPAWTNNGANSLSIVKVSGSISDISNIRLTSTSAKAGSAFIAYQTVAHNEAVWKGTAASHAWDDSVWTVEGTPDSQISEADFLVFDGNADFHTVTIGSDKTTYGMEVNTDLTLELQGAESTPVALTAKGITLRDGASLSLTGKGSVAADGIVFNGTNNINLADGTSLTGAGSSSFAAETGLTTTGAGSLEVTGLASTGGNINLGTDTHITGGGNGQGEGPNKQGLAMTDGSGQISITAGTTTVDGAVYQGGQSAGSINVGTGATDAKLVTTRLEMGDCQGKSSTLHIGANGTVVVKSANDANGGSGTYKDTGLILSEWSTSTTATVSGNLFAKDVHLYSGDTKMTLNIDGGTVAVKGISQNAQGKTGTANAITVSNNGKLILGEGGISANNKSAWTINLNGGELGITADSAIGKTVTLGGEVTVNTTKYTWNDNKELAGLGSQGGTLSMAGIAGTGSLTVVGNGTLYLTASPTFTGTLSVNDTATLNVAAGVEIGSGTTIHFAADSSLNVGGAMTLASDTTLKAVTLASGAELTLGDHTPTLITSSLTAAGDATINANLVMGDSSELNLAGTVTMGCTVELGTDLSLTLTTSVDPAEDLMVLFADAESVTLGANVNTYDTWIDASEVFSSITINEQVMTTSDYLVGVWENRILLTNVNSKHAPEPATATLSLLALAGLCARRRRK